MSNSNKLALFLLVLAASAGAKVMEDTVATVNGTPILLSEYQKELSTSMEYWSRAEPEALRDPANVKKLRESTLEELINREVLYHKAKELGLKARERDIENGLTEIKQRFARDEEGKELSEAQAEDAFQKQLKADGMTMEEFRRRLEKQVMARKLIDQEVRSKAPQPDEKAVKAYFEKVKDWVVSGSTVPPKGMPEDELMPFMQVASQVKAMSSERVRVSRILVKISPNASANEKKRALKTAQEIKKKLDAGASFAETAKEDSEDPETAARGGDLGYVIRGVAPPDFEKAAFSLEVGAISDPIPTEIGYNIIRVQEKRAKEKPEFEPFAKELTAFLANIAFQKELEAYVKSVKAKAVIERSSTAASN